MSSSKVRKKGIFLRFLPLIVFFVTFGAVMALTSLPAMADDFDVDLHDVMEGNVPNLSATVAGSGTGWYASVVSWQ